MCHSLTTFNFIIFTSFSHLLAFSTQSLLLTSWTMRGRCCSVPVKPRQKTTVCLKLTYIPGLCHSLQAGRTAVLFPLEDSSVNSCKSSYEEFPLWLSGKEPD